MPQYLSHQRMGHACAFYDDPKQPYVIISGKMFLFKNRYMINQKCILLCYKTSTGGDEKGQRSTTELYYLKDGTIKAGGNLKNGRSGHNLVSVESGDGKPNKVDILFSAEY